MSKQLYLIALLPPEDIREDVRQLKLIMKKRFDASHALKSPAHITLQMPFRREDDFENKLIESLQDFASHQTEFNVNLNGFDVFPPRVLFIKVEDHLPIQNLHSNLNKLLTDSLSFSDDELNYEIHPHLTIATRDLHKATFHAAWSEFKDRDFQTSFELNSLFLLKHNGRFWEVFRELTFNDS